MLSRVLWPQPACEDTPDLNTRAPHTPTTSRGPGVVCGSQALLLTSLPSLQNSHKETYPSTSLQLRQQPGQPLPDWPGAAVRPKLARPRDRDLASPPPPAAGHFVRSTTVAQRSAGVWLLFTHQVVVRPIEPAALQRHLPPLSAAPRYLSLQQRGPTLPLSAAARHPSIAQGSPRDECCRRPRLVSRLPRDHRAGHGSASATMPHGWRQSPRPAR